MTEHVTLRLFRQLAPGDELDARTLSEGELTIGRDPEAGWVIPDPSKTVSRLHCAIALRDGRLTLRDDSTNGVFLRDGQRPPSGMPTLLQVGDTLALGAFLIRVDAASVQPKGATRIESPALAPVPTAAPAPPPAAAAGDGPRQGKLLDAFCAGAQMDASAFSDEDLVAVMQRLGAAYREMVQGLGELMSERTRMRVRHGLERTAVQAADNNPFRWAPPSRVAVDLLKSPKEGFLTAEESVRASFEDLRLHQQALASGLRPAVAAVLADLAPAAAAERLRGQSFLVKNRTSALWAEYVQLHAQLSEQLQVAGDGPAAQAFRDAYERTVADGA